MICLVLNIIYGEFLKLKFSHVLNVLVHKCSFTNTIIKNVSTTLCNTLLGYYVSQMDILTHLFFQMNFRITFLSAKHSSERLC